MNENRLTDSSLLDTLLEAVDNLLSADGMVGTCGMQNNVEFRYDGSEVGGIEFADDYFGAEFFDFLGSGFVADKGCDIIAFESEEIMEYLAPNESGDTFRQRRGL